MLITNQYGRALVSPNLYRVSADENLYTYQSYAGKDLDHGIYPPVDVVVLVINNVSPNNGSLLGGTLLSINGDYFSESSAYPLMVKVGTETCTILSSSQTNIQCKTPAKPSAILAQYHGRFFLVNDSSFTKDLY